MEGQGLRYSGHRVVSPASYTQLLAPTDMLTERGLIALEKKVNSPDLTPDSGLYRK